MTKLSQQAVALAYESHAVAPRVLAKGSGLIAEVIIAKARELGIPLTEEPEVISILMQLEVDEFIPPVLYAAIAEILVWAYSLDPKGVPLQRGLDD
jgi:flagellar biosynthesis protein